MHKEFVSIHNLVKQTLLVLLMIFAEGSASLLTGWNGWQGIPGAAVLAQDDPLRNLRDEYARLEREGMKENFHRQLSFTILQEYLPPGTRMTSGYRSPQRQLDLILRMARANNIPAPATASIDDENAWRPPLMALRQKGFIIAAPTHTPHATDEAVFDLSGADLNAIQDGCRRAEKAGMIKFKRIIFEARNNAVHVEIESVSPKAFNVLGRRPPTSGGPTGSGSGSTTASESEQRRSMLEQLQEMHDREPDPAKKIDYDRSKRNLLDPVADAGAIAAIDNEIEQHQRESQQLATGGEKGELIAKLSAALREGRHEDAITAAEAYAKAFPASREAQATLARIRTHGLIIEAQGALERKSCADCERANLLIDDALKLSPAHHGARVIKRDVEACLKSCEGSSTIIVVLGVVGFFIFAGSLTGYFIVSRPGSWLSGRMQSPPQWILEGVEGPYLGHIFALDKPEITIGAQGRPDGPSDIEICDTQRKISRRHCSIMNNGKQIYLMDESTNGTKVNGRDLDRGLPTEIAQGDLITLADEVVLMLRRK